MLCTGMDKEERIWREHELKLRSADTAHERYYRDAASLFSSDLRFADTALQGSAALNGGAAVATLAFIGALLTAETPRPLDYSPLATVLTIFGAGVLCSTVASGASYVAQWLYSGGHEEWKLTWDHPYIESTPKSRTLFNWGAAFHVVAVVLVITSYVAFVCGGTAFRDFALTALAISPPVTSP